MRARTHAPQATLLYTKANKTHARSHVSTQAGGATAQATCLVGTLRDADNERARLAEEIAASSERETALRVELSAARERLEQLQDTVRRVYVEQARTSYREASK